MSSLAQKISPARTIRAAKEPALLIYVVTLSSCAAILAVAVAAAEGDLGNAWAVVALAVIAIAAERGSVRLSHTTETSIALLPALLAAVLFGPFAAMVVAASSQFGDFRPPYLKWATYTSARAITGAVTGATALGIQALLGAGIPGIVVSTAACAALAEFLGLVFAAATRRVRGSGDL